MPSSLTEPQKELHLIRMLLVVVAVPVVVIILKTLKAIFIPLILAVFLAFIFAPLTSFLKRKHVPMLLILLITLVIIALFFTFVILILYAASNSIITGLPKYQVRFSELISNGSQMLTDLATRFDLAAQNIPLINVNTLFSSGSVSIPKFISTTMNAFVDSIWNIFLVLVFLIFILLEADKLGLRLKRVMSKKMNEQTMETLLHVQYQIQNYLMVKTLISLATALVGMGLMLLYGVDFVLVCGILLFVLNFIPNIGSIIASGIPMVICLLQGGFDLRLLFFSLLITATQMVFGNILEPRLQGNRLNLTPIMVLISLIFWGWLWGIIGMLICVPLTSAINIVLKQLDPDNMISAIISSE